MEGLIMADIKMSSMTTTPFGDTANRPAAPAVGQIYHNGEIGVTEIYTANGWVSNSAPPAAPSIGSATNVGTARAYNNGSATITFTAGTVGGVASSYIVTSSPGAIQQTGSASPITVSGLTAGTAYTFSVSAQNNYSSTPSAIASNSITATTLANAPTIGAATSTGLSGEVTVAFTAPESGGSAVTNYSYSIDGNTYTALSPAQITSPLTVTGLTNSVSQTIRIKAINANGSSAASSASNSFTPTSPRATGGTVTISGGNYYHTFSSSGTFTPSASFTASALAVGAGGGGGNGGGGGAGGGFVRLITGQSVTSGTGYSITMGAGGTGGTTNTPNGSNATIGTSTTVFGQTCVGGGPGGGYQSNAPTVGTFANGGGGGNGQSGGTGTGSTGNAGSVTIGGLTVNGFQGGSGGASPIGNMAGAGGAGARTIGGAPSGNYGDSPSNGQPWIPGVGGNGFQWTTALGGNNNYYAGGGSGGWNSNSHGAAGGLGGGGTSGALNTASVTNIAGTANTGGGGSGASATGGNGGSGVVIVSYSAV